MNCKDVEPLIYLHAGGELSEQEQQIVRHHLDTCESCRKLDASLNTMRTLTLGTGHIPDALPTAGSILSTLAKEQQPDKVRRLLTPLRLAAASLLLLMVSALAYQEVQFSHDLAALEHRIQQQIPGDAGNENECLRKLKRRLSSPVYSGGYQALNALSEAEINGYLRQVCGTGDAGALKEILHEAGVKHEVPTPKM